MVRDGDVRKYLVIVEELIPVPTEFSLLVGDVCNNARSVLDHLLWQLWLLVNPMFDGRVTFPVIDTPLSCEEFNRRTEAHIGGLADGQRALIEGLQPYNTGDKSLGVLRNLNNSDKHRIIQVFAVSAKTRILEIHTLKGHPAVGGIKYRYAERVEMKNRAVLAKLQFQPDFIGDKVEVKAEFTFDVAFRGSKTANGLNVNPALQECVAAVQDALSMFEGEFPGTSTEKE